MQMEVEGVAIWALSRDHDNDAAGRYAPQLSDCPIEVLHVLERVRADDSVEFVIAKR